MHVAGTAYRIGVDELDAAMQGNNRLQKNLLRFVYTQLVQRDETALAASKGKMIERLSRWLLMVQDRLDTSNLPLTHDVLAGMLATRRAGVTTALGELKADGLVDIARGSIRILDREGLLRIAGVYYGAPDAEFTKLFEPAKVSALS